MKISDYVAGAGFMFLLLLAFTDDASAALPPSYSGQVNPCSDGYFLDIGEKQCKKLDTALGFDEAAFLAAHDENFIREVADCNLNSFNQAINDIQNNGGGTLNLGACTLTVTNETTLPNGILLQGKGADKTFITWPTSFTNARVLSTENNNYAGRNVVVRDFQMHGHGDQPGAVDEDAPPHVCLAMTKMKNALIERIHIRNCDRNAVILDHSQQVTARYLYLHDNGQQAIGAKDCFVNASRYSRATCRGGVSEADFWANDIVFASIRSHNNNASGLDPHISNLEMAGNEAFSNTQSGTKIPEPAYNVWIHDNYIRNAGKQGVYPKTQYCGTVTQDMQNYNFVVYRNRIVNNTNDYGLRFEYVNNNIVKDNIHAGNGNGNSWYGVTDSCGSSNFKNTTVFLCPGSDITTANSAGNSTNTNINDSRCDLSNVANIFN